MSEENKYMDDSFRKMSEEVKASYNSSFWEQAKADLENDSLDGAFRQAADSVSSFASADIASQSLSDAFMDEAFRDGAANLKATYDPAFWTEMADAEAELNMDDSFFSASKKMKANYHPIYWGDANSALEEEGLHYEYNSAYWDEAKSLLDKADRRLFFGKWAGVATILLLISTAGLKFGGDVVYTNTSRLFENGVNPKTESLASVDISENGLPTGANEQIVESETSVGRSDAQPNEIVQTSANKDDANIVTTPDEIDLIQNNNGEGIGTIEASINENTIAIADQKKGNTNNLGNASNAELTEVDKLNFEENDLAYIERIKVNRPNEENNMGLELLSNSMIEIDKFHLKPTHTFSLIGGAGLGKGFGVNPSYNLPRAYAGMEYVTRSFGKLKRFEFGGSAAVQGIREDGLVQENRTVRHLANTDSSSSWTKLKINDLVYLNANVFVNYRLTSKHILKFGIGIDHLLGVRSNMAYFIGETNDDSDQKNISTVNNNWGVENGIQKNDFRMSLGYEYRMKHNLSFQSNFNYGIFDRTEDEFYNQNTTFDNEMNVTLGIRYTFFTKI